MVDETVSPKTIVDAVNPVKVLKPSGMSARSKILGVLLGGFFFAWGGYLFAKVRIMNFSELPVVGKLAGTIQSGIGGK